MKLAETGHLTVVEKRCVPCAGVQVEPHVFFRVFGYEKIQLAVVIPVGDGNLCVAPRLHPAIYLYEAYIVKGAVFLP